MRNSIFIKSIIFFLVIFFISNALMVIVFLSSYYNSIKITNEEYMLKSSATIKKFYEKGMSYDEIINTISNNTIKINFYDTYQQIQESTDIQIYQYNKNKINKGDNVIIDGKNTFVIFKLDDKYCTISPLIKNSSTSIRMAIIVSAAITVIFAGFIVFLGVGTLVKPLINLSIAARKVAEGNYSIYLEPYETNDAIGQLVNDFNKMCKKLSQTEMLSNDFISSISHEFKTPIQSIYGFANLLKEECTNSEHMEYLNRISEEAERLSLLSSNILQINRLDNILDLNNKESYYLDEQLRQSILVLENKWNVKNINLNINLEKVKITAKQDMMKQVFINLLENAIKFTPIKGIINIILKKEKNNAIITIQDSGKGINEKEFNKIFEKFYKCDHSRNTTGNGLGLSIVKRIIDLHNFNLTVQNAEEGGAKFIISIPLSHNKRR